MQLVRIAAVCGAVALVCVCTARAEITREQQAQVAALKTAIDHAARLFKQEKLSESALEVGKCQVLLARAAEPGDAELIAALAPAHARLQKAHTLFAAKGVALPPLPPLGGDAPDEAAAEESGGSSGAISFTKQVAPILVARCGMCHMRRSMGEFSMATFAALSRGGENGPVIEAGQPEESLLVELVESGEMPPPRPRPRPVPPREVELIKDWVAQGAKFDGAGEDAPLLEMAPQRRTRNP